MVNSYKEDENLKEVSKIRTVLRLLSYLLKYKGKILVVFLLIGFGTFVGLVDPLFMERGIDTYIAAKNLTGFLWLMGICAGLNVLRVFSIKARMLIMSKLTNRVIEEIRDELYVHIQKLDLSFFDSRPSGKILARIVGDTNALKDVLENAITNLIPNFVTVIAVVVIMVSKNARLAAASLFGLPVLIIGVTIVSRKAHKYWQLNSKKNSNLSAFINEDLSGIKVVQGFTAENETDQTFKGLVKECRNAFLMAVRWADSNFAIIDFSWGLCIFALYCFGIKVLGVENVSVGTFIAFGTYIGMFWQPINSLSQFYNQLITAIAKAERIFEILDTEPKIVNAPDAKDLGTIKGSVEFENVTFGYEGVNPVTGAVVKSAKNVLQNTCFSVKAGETIALVGPTGAGKSTIVNLLSRFYDIQAGSILIDGQNIKDVTIESLRRQMGIMTQDNYIFSGTIRDNILYGKLDATEEEVLQAAKAVHAHDFIENLKDGYDTVLTSRGGELSNGQRQLLAFARTMISMPKILILDEATSSIDTQTEKLVQQGISELLKGRTSFVIAHRLSTIQNADRIFVVDKGGILESGTPAELLARKGEYYRLIQASAS